MNENASQEVFLVDRKELKINGVTQAVSATGGLVCFESVMGGMQVKGKNLRVEKLDTEKGDLYIVGEISEIKYVAAKKPLLKRLFK
jgi:sporulation protein YabP